MTSHAFLASPVFAGIDEARYQPEVILGVITKQPTLVALEADGLLGSVSFFESNESSPCPIFRRHPSFGLLAVDPTAKGHGMGTKLIEVAEAHAQKRLALSVTLRGTQLIDFYERLGYEKVQVFHWPGVPDASQIMLKRDA